MSPDSRWVVYQASYTPTPPDLRWELFAAPVDGSLPARALGGTPVSGGNVITTLENFQFSPDNKWVV